MVLADPPFLAHLAELAQRAVLDAVRFRGTSPPERSLEPTANAAVVGRVIGVAERAPLAYAEQHVHRLRRRPLNRGDPLAVEAELQHVRRLLGARELGVDRLVAPCAERRPALHALEEVGTPAPVTLDERRLVDDLGARPHGLDRGARGRLEVPGVRRRRIDDLAPLRAQPL